MIEPDFDFDGLDKCSFYHQKPYFPHTIKKWLGKDNGKYNPLPILL